MDSPTPSPATGAPPPAPLSRYPGVRPFGRAPADQQRFFGRETEVQTLLPQVLGTALIVVYGRSGVGKSSLFNAGLIPRLEEREFLPLSVRFNQADQSLHPLSVIVGQIREGCEREGVELESGGSASLWEYLKTTLFWRNETLLTPVLIFDQFEEVLNLQTAEFRRQLGIEIGQVLGRRLPEELRRQLQQGKALPFSERPPEVRLVIGIREDYVGALEELAPEVPGILLNRFRLTGLAAADARRAILNPAELVSAELALRTAPFAYSETALQEVLNAALGESDSIEPFLLQLFCSHIELKVADAQRTGRSAVVVQPELYGGDAGLRRLTSDFYLDGIRRLPSRTAQRRARRLCEEGLLTGGGRRRSVDRDELVHEYDLEPGWLDALEDARLVRKEPRLGTFYYELSHDRVARAVRDHRQWRLPPRLKWAVWIVGPLLIVLVVLTMAFQRVATARQRLIAENATQKADTALEAQRLAEEQRRRAEAAKVELEAAQRLSDTQREAAERAQVAAEEQRQEAQAARETAETLRLSAEASAREARQAREEAEKLVDYLVTDLQTDLNRLGARNLLAKVQTFVGDYYKRLGTLEGSDAIQRRRAVSILNQADLAKDQGQRDKARTLYDEALSQLLKLQRAQPDQSRYALDLADCYQKLGVLLVTEGNRAEALSMFQRSLAVRKELAESKPENLEWQRALAQSYDALGRAQSAEGRRTASLEAYRKSLAMSERLTETNPANGQWRRDLAAVLDHFGIELAAEGQRQEALKAFRRSLAITQKLAEADPENRKAQRDLALCYDHLATGLKMDGQRTEALAMFRNSLALRKALTQIDPDSVPWRRELSISHDNLGRLLAEDGQSGPAQAEFLESLKLRQALAANDPNNARHQGDLAVSHDDLGGRFEAEGERARALVEYRASLTIREMLAKRDPANVEWQCGRAASYRNIGALLAADGQRTAALTALRTGLQIAAQLAQTDPDNVQWQMVLVTIRFKLGRVLEAEPGTQDEARTNYQKCLEVLARLQAQDRLDADQRTWTAIIETRLEEMPAAPAE